MSSSLVEEPVTGDDVIREIEHALCKRVFVEIIIAQLFDFTGRKRLLPPSAGSNVRARSPPRRQGSYGFSRELISRRRK